MALANAVRRHRKICYVIWSITIAAHLVVSVTDPKFWLASGTVAVAGSLLVAVAIFKPNATLTKG